MAISEDNIVNILRKLVEEIFYCLNILYSPGLVSTATLAGVPI